MQQKSMPQILVAISSLFFVGTYLFFGFDLVLSTKALVASSAVVLVILGLFYRQETKKNQWLILAASIAFGSLTIFFGDGDFIKWRTTVVNILIGLTLLGMFYMKKSPAKMLFGKHMDIEVPEKEWLRTNIWWAIYMFFMAALNAVIVLFVPSDDIWMTFKMAVNPVLTFVLMIGALLYLSKKSQSYKKERDARSERDNEMNRSEDL
ncbi:inner membrane-spanning protein YciB [Ignatzschineria sp. LJL83]